MKKILVLFTLNFPFGNGEEFIENEIIEFHTSNIFGKIRSPRPAPIYSDSPINGSQLKSMPPSLENQKAP